MTGLEKAAVLLLSLPPAVAERVLFCLDTARTARLRQEMQRMEQSPRLNAVAGEVLLDFNARLTRAESQRTGAPATPLQRQAEAVRDEYTPAARRPEAPAAAAGTPGPHAEPPAARGEPDAMTALRQLSAEQLAFALRGETTQTISLVLNYLDADQTGEVLRRLPAEVRRDVSVHLGGQSPINPDVAQRIARALLRKSRPPEAAAEGDAQRAAKVADMLRLLDRPERREILNALSQHDRMLAAGVQEHLYRFGDLAALSDAALSQVLDGLDPVTVGRALAGAPPELAARVVLNLPESARAAVERERAAATEDEISRARRDVADALRRFDLKD